MSIRVKTLDIDSMSTQDLSLMKHSAAIHMSCSLTSNERKVYNRMLHEARPTLARGVVHEVDIRLLESAISSKSNNRPHFRSMIEGLVTKPVRYNIFDKDKQSPEVWRMLSVLLAEVGFNEDYSMCRFSFPNTIVDLLKNPNLYARINLQIQSCLTTHHSLPLYEFFIDLLGARRNQVNYVFPVKDIRDLLDIKKDSYTDFKIFRRDVLGKTFKDINQNTDIQVEITGLNQIYDTNNRRQKQVTSVNVLVQRKQYLIDDLPLLPEASTNPSHTSIREYLMKVFENKAVIVEEILHHYTDEDYIRHNVNYAEQRHLAGKVDSLPAYARSSLEKNYAKYSPNKVSALAGSSTTKRSPSPSRAEANEDRERAIEAEQFKSAKKVVQAMTDEQVEQLQLAYEATGLFLKLDAKFKQRDSKVYQSNLVNFYMKSIMH